MPSGFSWGLALAVAVGMVGAGVLKVGIATAASAFKLTVPGI